MYIPESTLSLLTAKPHSAPGNEFIEQMHFSFSLSPLWASNASCFFESFYTQESSAVTLLPPSSPFHLANSYSAFGPQCICCKHVSGVSQFPLCSYSVLLFFFSKMFIAVFIYTSDQFFRVQIVNSVTTETGAFSSTSPYHTPEIAQSWHIAGILEALAK